MNSRLTTDPGFLFLFFPSFLQTIEKGRGERGSIDRACVRKRVQIFLTYVAMCWRPLHTRWGLGGRERVCIGSWDMSSSYPSPQILSGTSSVHSASLPYLGYLLCSHTSHALLPTGDIFRALKSTLPFGRPLSCHPFYIRHSINLLYSK